MANSLVLEQLSIEMSLFFTNYSPKQYTVATSKCPYFLPTTLVATGINSATSKCPYFLAVLTVTNSIIFEMSLFPTFSKCPFLQLLLTTGPFEMFLCMDKWLPVKSLILLTKLRRIPFSAMDTTGFTYDNSLFMLLFESFMISWLEPPC